MAGHSRARLLHLVGLNYRRNAWRRGREVDGLLAQFHNNFYELSGLHGRWIPYSMPAVDLVREALEDGTIQPALMRQVIRYAYRWALARNRTRVTRAIVRMAINHVLHVTAHNQN